MREGRFFSADLSKKMNWRCSGDSRSIIGICLEIRSPELHVSGKSAISYIFKAFGLYASRLILALIGAYRGPLIKWTIPMKGLDRFLLIYSGVGR